MRCVLIVPCYNAALYLPDLLLLLTEWLKVGSDKRILFIDSSSQDDTVKLLEAAQLGRILHVDSKSFDHGGTRAWAAQQLDAEIVVFMTQDALPVSVDDIDRLVGIFEDPLIVAAYGRQLPYANCHFFGHHLRQFNYGEHSYVRELKDTAKYGIKTAFLSNSFAAYRRSALEQIGWFKDGLILGEDSYAGGKLLMAGYKLAYVAEAEVYHSHNYTIWQEFKRYFDIGVFHAMEPWLLVTFGKPEGEGMRYIKSEFGFLCDRGDWGLLPEFVLRNAMKWLGYKLGKHYQYLPSLMLPKLSMHHRWWKKS